MSSYSFLFRYSELVSTKVIANLKAEASKSYLSYLWWILEPILHMMVYYLVFGLLLNRGTEDFVVYLKSAFLDSVYLQQNGFDEVDASTTDERQKYVFSKVIDVLRKELSFKDKTEARDFFYNLRHRFIDWNYKKWESDEFKEQEKEINGLLEGEDNEESMH